MDSFINLPAWTTHQSQAQNATSSRPFGHFRSLSSITKSQSPHRPARIPGKSPSTSELPNIPLPLSGTSSPAIRPVASPLSQDDDGELSTLPDPRSRTMSPANDDGDVSPPPDLNDEVRTLSSKLIIAINHQTVLDNSLSSTKHELELARERVKQLEGDNARQQEMLSGDVWVKRKNYEHEKKELQSRVADEKAARHEVEKEKRKIELELENLTTALFEEANKMVVSAKEEARKDREALQKKNDQLRAQIADTETLLQSQQEQLAELKTVMEHMTTERDDTTTGTAPSSPAFSKFEPRTDEQYLSDGQLVSPLTEPVSPAYPTSFAHLIQPVLRTDLASYEDFKLLSRLSRTRAASRVSSGSFALGGSLSSSALSANASTSSLPTTSPHTPNTPGSPTGSPSTHDNSAAPALKDTKFYRRILVEDVEPTLRLDVAPGLSWLARRSVLNSMIDGSLVVEPALTTSPGTAASNPQHYNCSLCGESRRDPPFLRTHRFRTSESESAQRYPLCAYCLGRVRSTCDFLGFLRILKDGHWRTDDADSEKAAWEESVRLREHMFWSRIGGGVIPAGHQTAPSCGVESRNSEEATAADDPDRRPGPAPTKETETERRSHEVEANMAAPSTPTRSARNSTQSLEVKASPETIRDGTQRLSLTIPTSTDTIGQP